MSDQRMQNSMIPMVGGLGFGEAAGAFVSGWSDAGIDQGDFTFFDIKTRHADAAVAAAKQADYRQAGVTGCADVAEAVGKAELVFSLVTAGEARKAAESAAGLMLPGAFYLDCNSCAPQTKAGSARVIEAAGGRYVDVAVMAPVYPKRHEAPLLLSGPHAEAVLPLLEQLGMKPEIIAGEVGRASSIKMIRSVMVKGMEALMLECILAGRRAGVDHLVLDSLAETFPEIDWRERADYQMERVMTHGIRRAEEVREVAVTVRDLGLSGALADATARWQQQVGELGLHLEESDYGARADAILEKLFEKDGS